MHRAVFLKAWGQLPRWGWCLILLYSHCLWVLFYSWKQTIAALYGYGKETQRRAHISIARQLLDLLNIALLHGIPPGFYYAYGLYGQPRERWWQYVYTHELPHWHTVMCGHQDLSAANRILSDKQAFALEMVRAGIRTPEILAAFHRGDRVDAERIFLQQSCFLKPSTGSRGEGCFELLYDRTVKDYRVVAEEIVDGEDAVLAYIQQKVLACDYIVQPLLVNHPEMHRLCNQARLATVRLITGHDRRKPACIAAVLEIPRPDERKRWWQVPVDCRTGLLTDCVRQGLASFYQKNDGPPDLTGEVVPCWEDTLDICLRAHEYFPAVAAVGWDVGVTPSGVVLIEGNFNWRTDSLQTVSAGPLLKTKLFDIYASRLWSNSSPPVDLRLDCRDT